jgi:lactate dehydrogenase-like 2-hydroxyacid dehydrogenase
VIHSFDSRLHVSFRPSPEAQARLAELPFAVTWADSQSGQDRASLLADVAGAAALVSLLTDRVDAELLDAAGPELRIVANLAVGYDNVDVSACAARGIVVTNTPGVLDEATADLAFALVLASARRIVEADAFLRRGEPWTWRPDLFVGLDISGGATLGIVGLGRIGLAVARRAQAFSMRVVATPARSAGAAAERLGITTMPLPQLLIESDVVTLHCPLTPETRHLIGREELELMGPGSILVNTARGPIVDEAALAAALAAGTIAAAGLDVFEHEPQIHPDLLELPNVVLLPHIGSAGRATRDRMAALAIDNARAVLVGEPPLSPVTPG